MSTLRQFNKWTARVALVVLVFTLLFGLAFIPTGRHNDTGRVWPLSHHFSAYHDFANIEMMLGWIMAVICALIFIGICGALLLRRAEWIK
jgi:ABC-type thiamin/hydroxymethylpyrimidine transport system permease subunit